MARRGAWLEVTREEQGDPVSLSRIQGRGADLEVLRDMEEKSDTTEPVALRRSMLRVTKVECSLGRRGGCWSRLRGRVVGILGVGRVDQKERRV